MGKSKWWQVAVDGEVRDIRAISDHVAPPWSEWKSYTDFTLDAGWYYSEDD